MKEDEKSWFEPLRANVTEAVATEDEKTAAAAATEGNEEPPLPASSSAVTED